jgi:hypothetical protein
MGSMAGGVGVGLLAAAALLGACGGKAALPCSGATCLTVTGEYLFVLPTPVICPQWQENTRASAFMSLTATGSTLSAVLWDNTTHPHQFSGTLFADGTMQVSEPAQNQQLGLPVATLSGSFTPLSGGIKGFQFTGSLQLTSATQSSSTSAGSGGSNGSTSPINCGVTVSLNAEEQSVSAPVDAGPTVFPDGGHS